MNIRDKKKNIVCVSQCMYVCVCVGGGGEDDMQ